jgi:hypothetical protein
VLPRVANVPDAEAAFVAAAVIPMKKIKLIDVHKRRGRMRMYPFALKE